MPTKPKIVTLTNSSVDVVNAIRNSASVNYRDHVPLATPDAESIRTIGAILMDNPQLLNEFSSGLINRIGLVVATSKMWDNPLRMFKRGRLDYGETVEEIFVDLAKGFTYDQGISETNLFKREKPDVRSAFHVMNFQKFYKVSVSPDQYRSAFLSWDGVTDLLERIISRMTTSANYDEFNVMKYMLGRKILEGRLKPVAIPAISAENSKTIVSDIKGASNTLEFMSNDNNPAGVYNATAKDDQYLIVNAKFDSLIDVEVLASAFHMDKATFYGHKVLVDSFGNIDNARMAQLFDDDDSNYTALTSAEKAALDAIPAVLVDRDFFMIFDNLITMRDVENGEGLYRNYWLHTWKTFSVSPFANALVFVPGTPAVSSVTVSPSTATLAEGSKLALTATVATADFAPKSVIWSSADSTKVTVNAAGIIQVVGGDAEDTVVITATSTFDSTKTGTCTVTIA